MPVGKPISRSKFYGSNELGGIPNIAMPAYGERTILDDHMPNHNYNHAAQPTNNNSLFNIPDELPREVMQEMNQFNDNQQDVATTYEAQEDNIEESVEQVQEQQEPSKSNRPSPQDSFKAMREAKERAEREADEIRREMQNFRREMSQYQSNFKQQAPVQEEDVDIDLSVDDDSLVEARHMKKFAKRVEKLERKIEEDNKYVSQNLAESKIRANFPDFDKVVSVENVQRLEQYHPDIAQMLRSNKDLYSMASCAYSVMKQYGIYKEDVYQEDRFKAKANVSKPRPLNSISPQQSDTPLSKANAFSHGLTDDLKAQLRKEMLDARRRM